MFLSNLRRQLWFQWISLSAIGWLSGLVAAFISEVSLVRLLRHLLVMLIVRPNSVTGLHGTLIYNIGDAIPGNFIGTKYALSLGILFGFCRGAAFGMVGGYFQFLVLRRYLGSARLWVFANTFLWACIWATVTGYVWGWGWQAIHLAHSVYGLVGAITFSICQWLVLYQQNVKQSYWWIVATIISWAASNTIVLKLAYGSFYPLPLLWGLVGIANGLFTAMPLTVSMRPRITSQ